MEEAVNPVLLDLLAEHLAYIYGTWLNSHEAEKQSDSEARSDAWRAVAAECARQMEWARTGVQNSDAIEGYEWGLPLPPDPRPRRVEG